LRQGGFNLLKLYVRSKKIVILFSRFYGTYRCLPNIRAIEHSQAGIAIQREIGDRFGLRNRLRLLGKFASNASRNKKTECVHSVSVRIIFFPFRKALRSGARLLFGQMFGASVSSLGFADGVIRFRYVKKKSCQ
jgi:hypothetical protein